MKKAKMVKELNGLKGGGSFAKLTWILGISLVKLMVEKLNGFKGLKGVTASGGLCKPEPEVNLPLRRLRSSL